MGESNTGGEFRVTMPGKTSQEYGEASPWSKVVKLTQRIVNVPKEEANRQAENQAREKSEA